MQQKPLVEAHNWQQVQQYVGLHWRSSVEIEDNSYDFDFIPFVRLLNKVKDIRNTAAHINAVSRTDYGKMQDLVCQMSPLGKGLMNVLLLAWH